MSTVNDFVMGWSEGNFERVLEACGDGVTFQIPGKSTLAGKYTESDFVSHLSKKFTELSGGTYRFTAHDILVSDLHATVLGTASIMKNGKKEEYRTVHVMRLDKGRPIAWYEYPRDLYAFDSLWT